MKLKNINFNMYRNARIIFHNLLHSLIFRIFAVCFLVLFIFSTAIFYIEKGYTRTITRHGECEVVESNINSIEDSIWWAIVTSTTVGMVISIQFRDWEELLEY